MDTQMPRLLPNQGTIPKCTGWPFGNGSDSILAKESFNV